MLWGTKYSTWVKVYGKDISIKKCTQLHLKYALSIFYLSTYLKESIQKNKLQLVKFLDLIFPLHLKGQVSRNNTRSSYEIRLNFVMYATDTSIYNLQL